MEYLRSLKRREIDELLEEIDVLIDGEFVAEEYDPDFIRGSTGQGIHHLSSRLVGRDFRRKGQRKGLNFGGGKFGLIRTGLT